MSQRSILDVWASGETEQLMGLLAETVVFSSPVADYEPRVRASHVLGLIPGVVDEVRATMRWDGDRETVSAFTARIGDDRLDGMLREERDGSGALVHVTLFLRPYRSLTAAIGRMRELLAESPLPEPPT
jgi:hypothetical protein